MATTLIPPSLPDTQVTLDGEISVTIRPTTPEDAASLLVFLASPGVRYLCSEPEGHPNGCTHCRTGGLSGSYPALVGVTRGGEALSIGWLEADSSGGPARLAVAIGAAYQQGPLGIAMIHLLAARAVELGYDHFTTCITSLRGDPFEEFRAAGLRVESSFALGGVTEVELSFE